MYDDEERVGPEYVSLQTLAALLDVSVSTLHRLRRRGVLPKRLFIRFGARLVRVDMAAFRQWLEEWDGVIREAPARQAPQSPRSVDDGGPGLRILR